MTAAILILALTAALCTIPTVPLLVTYFLLLARVGTLRGRVVLRAVSAVYLWLLWRLAAAIDEDRFSMSLGKALAWACAATAGLLLVSEARFAIRRAQRRRQQGPELPPCSVCRQSSLQPVSATPGETAGGMYGLEGTQLRCQTCGALSWMKRAPT